MRQRFAGLLLSLLLSCEKAPHPEASKTCACGPGERQDLDEPGCVCESDSYEEQEGE